MTFKDCFEIQRRLLNEDIRLSEISVIYGIKEGTIRKGLAKHQLCIRHAAWKGLPVASRVEAAQLYADFHSARFIARKLGYIEKRVYRGLRASGVRIRPRGGGMSRENWLLAIDIRQLRTTERLTFERIACRVGVSPCWARRLYLRLLEEEKRQHLHDEKQRQALTRASNQQRYKNEIELWTQSPPTLFPTPFGTSVSPPSLSLNGSRG